jgi:hypothetical protein
MPFSIRSLRRLPQTYFSGFMSLITLLVLSSSPVYAEWVAVSVDAADIGMTVYMDPDTIRHKGDLVKGWLLYDFKTAQTKTYGAFLSFKALSEFDCTEERTRQLAVTHFSGNMGRGKVVYTDSDQGKWHPVAPESIGQTVWKAACDEK